MSLPILRYAVVFSHHSDSIQILRYCNLAPPADLTINWGSWGAYETYWQALNAWVERSVHIGYEDSDNHHIYDRVNKTIEYSWDLQKTLEHVLLRKGILLR